MTMNENGPKWARGGLILGVIASVVGNVANAFLTETTVSIVLRAPLAVVWPAFLFVAVEVLVRNRGSRGPLARLGQAALLTVTVPTAITSFLNLHALMVKANEPGMAQLTGPLAIDGVMLGCTIMLLAVRVRDTDMGQDSGTADTDKPERVQTYVTEADTYTEADMMSWAARDSEEDMDIPMDTGHEDTPLSLGNLDNYMSRLSAEMGQVDSVPAAPVSAVPVVPGHGTRTVRPAAPSDLDSDVADMLSQGKVPAEIKRVLSERHGVHPKTVGRRITASAPGVFFPSAEPLDEA